MSHLSVNGESKSKKNKKDVKPMLKVENAHINNIENLYHNYRKVENILKTTAAVTESVPHIENREVYNQILCLCNNIICLFFF